MIFGETYRSQKTRRKRFTSKISKLLHHHFTVKIDNEPEKMIHHLSQYEYQKIVQWIEEALEKVPIQMRNLSKNLEDLNNKRQKVADMINKAPSDDVVGPLMQKLNESNQNLGQTY